MFKCVEKIEDKCVSLMQAHPKFTKFAVSGTAALATIGSTGIVASADDDVGGAAADTDVIDTVISTMSDTFSGAISKALPAAITVGGILVAVTIAWRLFKKFAK